MNHHDDLPAWEARLSPVGRWLVVAVISVSFGTFLGLVCFGLPQ